MENTQRFTNALTKQQWIAEQAKAHPERNRSKSRTLSPAHMGFDRARAGHNALDAIRTGITLERQRWVIDANLSKYFDRIERNRLHQVLVLRINDGVFRRIARVMRSICAN